MLQCQHYQLAETVQRLGLPGQSTLPAGTQAATSPAAAPMDQASGPFLLTLTGGFPSSILAVTSTGVPPSSRSGSGELRVVQS